MKPLLAIILTLMMYDSFASTRCENVKEQGFKKSERGMTHFRNARKSYKDAQEFAKERVRNHDQKDMTILCDKLKYTFFQAKKCEDLYAASVLYYENVQQNCAENEYALANKNILDMTQNVEYCQNLMRKSKAHYFNGCQKI